MKVEPEKFIVVKKASEKFVREENFSGLKLGQIRNTLLRLPVTENYPNRPESAQNVTQAHIQLGSKDLVSHIFG